MLCGCANSPPVEPRAASTATTQVDAVRHAGYSDARRLIVPSPPVSLRRHRFSVRVQPSPGAGGAEAPSRQSAESSPRLRTRSYTLTDGATSAIGRILTTCFHDTQQNGDADAGGGGTGSSDDLQSSSARSRPRSRSLWSRRRSPVATAAVGSSCLPASSSPGSGVEGRGGGGGCGVDVVLDCSPGTVRRRRLQDTQSAASSTSSTLHCSDHAALSLSPWITRVVSHHNHSSDFVVSSSDLTLATSFERLLSPLVDAHPVWERRQVDQRGRGPVRQRAAPTVPQTASSTVIPDHPTPSKTSPPRRRRITARATTCAIPLLPKVRVVQTASGGGPLVKTENGVQEQCIKPTSTASRVSR